MEFDQSCTATAGAPNAERWTAAVGSRFSRPNPAGLRHDKRAEAARVAQQERENGEEKHPAHGPI
jgi:hypothetical protein